MHLQFPARDIRPSFEPVPLQEMAVLLHPSDNVAVTKQALERNILIEHAGTVFALRQAIPAGHKIALCNIPAGGIVRRYGQAIGCAKKEICCGEHVHTHNLLADKLQRDYFFCSDLKAVSIIPHSKRRVFQGYARPDGRAGTRNYVAVISTVNCAAHTAQRIAHHFDPQQLAAYPDVDGVIALTGALTCAMQVGGPEYVLLQRTLAGMARHPNVGAVCLVGLGCETNQISELVENYDLKRQGGTPLRSLTIQEMGGVQKCIRAGIAMVQTLLPLANQSRRSPQPISELCLALQCGGSDSWSGITANPLIGQLSDEIVRQGGTIILAETPEIYGAEHLLTCRAQDLPTGHKLLEMVRWWENRVQVLGTKIDNNPSHGNKVGGLTTIYEKALGAIAKSGHTPLVGVYDYAEAITDRGFTFMNTPGFDPVSVTGQVAGGANLVLFSTGRGSAFGFYPAPSIKIASNSALYEHMIDDMDLNAGVILEGESMNLVAARLLELVIEIASGRQSKSEAQGIGEAEFCPWSLGETL